VRGREAACIHVELRREQPDGAPHFSADCVADRVDLGVHELAARADAIKPTALVAPLRASSSTAPCVFAKQRPCEYASRHATICA